MPRYVSDALLPPVGDEAMRAAMATTRPYSVVILRDGPRADHPDRDRIVWEHGRRNFRLRAAGLLAVVLPVRDESEVDGIGVFDLGVEETRAVMAADPGVQAGVFVFAVHPARSFPGDRLPAAPWERSAAPGGTHPEPVERFHGDGSLWARGFLQDGEEHGEWEWFRTDGTRMRSGAYDRGTRIGLWVAYDREGRVLKRAEFPGPAGTATDHTTDDPHPDES